MLPSAADAARALSAMPRGMGRPRRRAQQRATHAGALFRRRQVDRAAHERPARRDRPRAAAVQQRRESARERQRRARCRAGSTPCRPRCSTPIETPDYPGVRFTVQCADIASAVATLARSNGRMLATLSWRGTEVERVLSRWRPEQFVEISARNIARANPWAACPAASTSAYRKDRGLRRGQRDVLRRRHARAG